MRIPWITAICLVIWLYDWVIFILGTSDFFTLAAPFMILTVFLPCTRPRKREEGSQPVALFPSTPTEFVLFFVALLAFLIYIPYPFMSLLMWNIIALTVTILAYHVSTNDASEHISDKSAEVMNQ